MVSNRPYGDVQIVKNYCSNIKLQESTYTAFLTEAATDLEAAFHLNGGEFPTDYVYYNKIKGLVEKKAACLAHLTYGLRTDAKIYCDLVKDGIAELKVDDTMLETTDGDGTLEPSIPETFPANPIGLRLIGRSTETGDDTIPPYA